MSPASGGLTGYVTDQVRPGLEAVGAFVRMCVLTGRALFRPFQWREFILQSWFLMRVAFLPTIAVAIPLTVLIIFTLNILLAVVDVNVCAADSTVNMYEKTYVKGRIPNGNAKRTQVAVGYSWPNTENRIKVVAIVK